MDVPGYILHDLIGKNLNTNLLVHRATKIDNNQKVILKINKQKGQSTNNELVIVSKLAGVKGVPKLLDQLPHQDGACTIFQDDDFVNLSSVIPIKLDTFLPLAINIARSLGEIHNNLVARLDLKADSIFFNKKSFEVKFVEFSKASVFSRESTRTNNDQRLDLRDLGLTFCHMLSGELPSKDCSTPQSFKPYPALDQIINKLLSPTSPRHYSTAFSLVEDLLRFSNSEKIKPPSNYDLPWLTESMTSLRGLSHDELIQKSLVLLKRNNFNRIVLLSAKQSENGVKFSILAESDNVKEEEKGRDNALSPNNNHHNDTETKIEADLVEDLVQSAYHQKKLLRWFSSELAELNLGNSHELCAKSNYELEAISETYVKKNGISATVSVPFFGSISGAFYLESRRVEASLFQSHAQSLEAFVAHFAVLLDNASLSKANQKRSKRNFVSAVDPDSESAVWGRFYSSLAQAIDKIVIPSIPPSNESKFNIMVETLEMWDFDIFEFDRICEGRSLYYMSCVLFKKHNLIKHFNIEETKLKNFMMLIDDGYRQNPYHNSTHAADVSQTIHYYLTTGDLAKLLTEADILSMLVAAIIHDYKHPGLTNKFLIDTTDPISIIYNDTSVLENYHLAESFAYLLNEETNILHNLPSTQRQEIRRSIIQTVLSTDLANHVSILAQFNEKTAQGGASQDRPLLLKVFVKSADISHPVKPTSLHKEWSSRLIEEFYLQGERETRCGLPISTFMDRQNPAVSTCQLGFIHFFVEPLFKATFSVLSSSAQQTMGKFLNDNVKYWKDEQRREDELLNNDKH